METDGKLILKRKRNAERRGRKEHPGVPNIEQNKAEDKNENIAARINGTKRRWHHPAGVGGIKYVTAALVERCLMVHYLHNVSRKMIFLRLSSSSPLRTQQADKNSSGNICMQRGR